MSKIAARPAPQSRPKNDSQTPWTIQARLPALCPQGVAPGLFGPWLVELDPFMRTRGLTASQRDLIRELVLLIYIKGDGTTSYTISDEALAKRMWLVPAQINEIAHPARGRSKSRLHAFKAHKTFIKYVGIKRGTQRSKGKPVVTTTYDLRPLFEAFLEWLEAQETTTQGSPGIPETGPGPITRDSRTRSPGILGNITRDSRELPQGIPGAREGNNQDNPEEEEASPRVEVGHQDPGPEAAQQRHQAARHATSAVLSAGEGAERSAGAGPAPGETPASAYERERATGRWTTLGLLGLFHDLYQQWRGGAYKLGTLEKNLSTIDALVDGLGDVEQAELGIRALFSKHLDWVKNKTLSFFTPTNVQAYVVGAVVSLRGERPKAEWKGTRTSGRGLIHKPRGVK